MKNVYNRAIAKEILEYGGAAPGTGQGFRTAGERHIHRNGIERG